MRRLPSCHEEQAGLVLEAICLCETYEPIKGLSKIELKHLKQARDDVRALTEIISSRCSFAPGSEFSSCHWGCFSIGDPQTRIGQ